MRVMALLNAARPPSRGIFSRCTMTTRLWVADESAERQFHLTVQPRGTTTWTSPARYPLINAEGAPAGAVTSIARVAVCPALSTTSQEGASARSGEVVCCTVVSIAGVFRSGAAGALSAP